MNETVKELYRQLLEGSKDGDLFYSFFRQSRIRVREIWTETLNHPA